MTSLDPSLRERLLGAKLVALVRSTWGEDAAEATPTSFPAGAALLGGGTLWVLAEDAPRRSLGPALLLATRRGATHLHLLASDGAGALARRAAAFRTPTTVWRIEGKSLQEAPAEDLSLGAAPPDAVEPFRLLFERAGAEAVFEAGLLRAEVRGLEVARVEVDDTGAHLAVGVGKHDREAKRTLVGNEQGWDELSQAVDFVSARRLSGGEGSPAYHLAAERWLRSVVVARPELVGAARLAPVPPPVVREDLREAVPAPAAGLDAAGEPVLVVCSVGIDLDLVPMAADTWMADGRRPRLILCVPEGDDHPAIRQLAALLVPFTEIRTVPSDWRTLAPGG